MKKLYIIKFLLLVLFFSLNSCTKDSIKDSPIDDVKIENRSEDIYDKLGIAPTDLTVFNGDMLWFKDKQTFINVMDALEDLRNDSVFVADYLNSLGLTENDEDSLIYPWEPALASFASNFEGFNALGTEEENREKQFYLNGGNPSDFDDHFILNEVKQYMLNDKLEVKVGDYIYKMVDRFNQYVIRNDDITALNTLRNSSNLLNEPLIENAILLNSSIIEDLSLYKRLTGDLDQGFFNRYFGGPPPCSVSINMTKFKGANKYRFIAVTNNPTMTDYTWTITDATGQVVYSHNGYMDIWFDWTPPNNNYPFTVSVVGKGDENCKATDQVIIENACNCGFDFYLTEYSDANHFTIYFKGVEPCNGLNLQVDWGDGTVQNYYSGDAQPYHVYSEEDALVNVDVCVTLTTDTGCNTTICKTIYTGCGLEPPFKHKENEYYSQSNKRRKLKYYLYVDYPGIFSTDGIRTKAKSKNYYKTWFGWYRTKADKLEINYIDNSKIIYDCQDIVFCWYGCENTNKSILNCSCSVAVQADIVTVKPGYVTAEFFVTEFGHRYGPYYLKW